MEAAEWVNLSDDELLERKISQLGLKLDGTELQPLVQRLHDELSAKGLQIDAAFANSAEGAPKVSMTIAP